MSDTTQESQSAESLIQLYAVPDSRVNMLQIANTMHREKMKVITAVQILMTALTNAPHQSQSEFSDMCNLMKVLSQVSDFKGKLAQVLLDQIQDTPDDSEKQRI
ncbi:hypothetical protein KJ652_06730 [Patescibacteria group bacterium]|nr:hypothetical protein [Patescibacteria group bacterium]MBU1124245.1 hypothetical protein [Patescibacteria group bacterium]MBU1910884.1 hypothetical protein [Patescibacteria group bacterium]